MMLLLLLPVVVLSFIDPRMQSIDQTCYFPAAEVPTLYGVEFFYLIIFTLLLKEIAKFRKFDAFGIRAELIGVVLFGVIFFVLYICTLASESLHFMVHIPKIHHRFIPFEDALICTRALRSDVCKSILKRRTPCSSIMEYI